MKFTVKTVKGKLFTVEASNSQAARKHIEKKYKTKVLAVHLAKGDKPKPKPVVVPAGPKLPPICTMAQMHEIEMAAHDVQERFGITLRMLSAGVDYLIRKDQYEFGVKEGVNA